MTDPQLLLQTTNGIGLNIQLKIYDWYQSSKISFVKTLLLYMIKMDYLNKYLLSDTFWKITEQDHYQLYRHLKIWYKPRLLDSDGLKDVHTAKYSYFLK